MQERINRINTLLEGRLAFMTGSKEDTSDLKEPMASLGFSLVSSDLHNNYVPFGDDFGPVNLGVLHPSLPLQDSPPR